MTTIFVEQRNNTAKWLLQDVGKIVSNAIYKGLAFIFPNIKLKEQSVHQGICYV